MKNEGSDGWRLISVVILSALFLCLCCGLFSVHAGEPTAAAEIRLFDSAANKVSPWLIENLRSAETNGFLVVLRDRADLTGASRQTSREDRVRYVLSALRNTAETSQASFRQWMDSRQIRYRPFHIANMILVHAGADQIPAIAARPEVLRIEGNPTVRGIETGFTGPGGGYLQEGGITGPSIVDGAEWGVSKVRAPEVWATYNVTGTGIVVGGNDTGVQWDHPALKTRYRGWNGFTADHNYNWHDAIHGSGVNPCGYDTAEPCDDWGHGTHTLGTAVGDDGAANGIGVAPGARWIACRSMDNGFGTPARYIECLEFFLAPYPVGGSPQSGDPSKAAHIVNNSWSCPAVEGCSAFSLRASVEALRAAGIEVVVSAGNTGSECGSISASPSFYEASFTVGATDSSDNIAGFSSRGPVTEDGSNRLKPDISAPGVDVRSAWTGSNYQVISGTSMAAPHVSGAVALLWSAVPSLKGKVCETEAYLTRSAVPRTSAQACGGIPGNEAPNNTFGWGRLDVYAAMEAAIAGALPRATLHISKAGAGAGRVTSVPSGIDCGTACTADYGLCENVTVTLTATADAGSTFTGWSGGTCSGRRPSCAVVITGDLSVTANFAASAAGKVVLSVHRGRRSGGDGLIQTGDSTINCGPGASACRNFYDRNTPVTLSAAAQENSVFTGWGPVSLCPGTGDCIVTMDRARTITAIFTGPQRLALLKQKVRKGDGTVTSSPGGIDCGIGCPRASASYILGQTVALSAVSDAGATFTGWRPVSLCPGTGDCIVTMDRARTITAIFTKPPATGERE